MTATATPLKAAPMHVEPMPNALGALVTGVDLRKLDAATFAAIHSTWLEQLVIVIRGQQITDDDLTAFSTRFGVLDEVPIVSKGQAPRYNKHISVISNIIENGVPIGGLGDDEVLWHSDTSYRDFPPSASVLHALEIPPAGGNTGFSNMYLALETLPPSLRERIDDLSVKQDITYTAGPVARRVQARHRRARVPGRDASADTHASRYAARRAVSGTAAQRLHTRHGSARVGSAARCAVEARHAGFSRVASPVDSR